MHDSPQNAEKRDDKTKLPRENVEELGYIVQKHFWIIKIKFSIFNRFYDSRKLTFCATAFCVAVKIVKINQVG